MERSKSIDTAISLSMNVEIHKDSLLIFRYFAMEKEKEKEETFKGLKIMNGCKREIERNHFV